MPLAGRRQASRVGQLNLDVVADLAAVPDVEAFAAGVSDTLGALGTLGALARTSGPRGRD